MSDDDGVVSDLEFRASIGEFDCPSCGKSCASMQGLRRHWSMTHPDENRPAKLESAPVGRGDVPPSDRKGKGARRKPSLEPGLTQWFVSIGMVVAMTDRDGFCGPHIAKNAQNMARAWDHLGQENPHVRRALEGLLTASAVGEVVTATFVCVAPILAQHKALPAQFRAMGASSVPDYPPPDMGGPHA